jgi:HK97 family phage major capsid protein
MADITTSLIATDGKLVNEQADQFIDLLVEEVRLLPMVEVIKMNNPTRDLDNMNFGSRKLVAGVEATAPTTKTSPTFSKQQLTAKEAILAIDVSFDFIEENIEREDFNSMMAGRIGKLLANDVEDLFLNGDESDSSAFLSINEGILELVKADNKHVYDIGTSTDDATILYNLLINMPSKWAINISSLRFFVSWLSEIRIRNTIGNRQTALGDYYITSDGSLTYMGIPVIGVPKMPNDHYLLCDPKNLALGVRREITFDVERKPRPRIWEYTWTIKFDMEVIIPDAIAIGYDVP